MKKKNKGIANLSSDLYNTGNMLERENYVFLSGGVEDTGNKSDVKVGGYTDTSDKSSGSYDVVVQSLTEVLDTLDSTDKPA